MDKVIKVTVPILKGTISQTMAQALYNKGYRKVRAVVVFPSMQDREAVCQGVACPTLYTDNHRGTNEDDVNKNTRDLYAQSSWFFRVPKSDPDKHDGTYTPENNNDQAYIPYVEKDGSPDGIKKVEIQGHYDDPNKFRIDRKLLTFHSPDVEFDESFGNADFSGLKFSQVGSAQISKTLASIDIQTETPSIDVDRSAGFTKMSFTGSRANGIISGLFYEDFPVDDDVNQTTGFVKYSKYTYPARWMVYPWNKNGSLNNDIDRPADKGVRSAVLRQKIISNLRYSSVTAYDGDGGTADFTVKPQLFSSNEDSILKLDTGQTNLSNVYQGNIDTLLMPDGFSGMHFAKMGIWVGAVDYTGAFTGESPVPFDYDSVYYKTFANVEEQDMHGVYFWQPSGWTFLDKNIGNEYLALVVKKENVRMKYKSTRHLVFGAEDLEWEDASLPVVELRRGWDDEERINKMFGGRSVDALKENVWIPCGNSVSLWDGEMSGDTRVFKNVGYYYEWGDTYYQRWDCLKTYAFTPDDANQIVEIGSFMLESRVNIDGRYDHNRGQMNNLYMSPINFNLLNPVYSQQNNFFSYRIQDSDFYKEKRYPNQITWSLVKTSGADVDKWTNVTLASILELDGDKGSIRKIIKLNDQLLCFQDKGISQILYNENTQISTTEGTPIEIANSGKVQGKKYVSDSIGCSNKWSIAQTPAGIYFMDSINKHIFMFNGQLNNLSGTFGFNAWSKKNIPAEEDIQWTPVFPVSNDGRSSFVSYYDKLNQDVLFINKDTALAFSEKLGVFTSFYDYGNSPYFCNLQDTGIWLRNETREIIPSVHADPIDIPTINIYRHQGGESYCSFFGETKPFWMTLVGNPEPQLDKIFTNLEFRACVDDDGRYDSSPFSPFEPIDSLEVWNEYQHGFTNMVAGVGGHDAFKHPIDKERSTLKRKFRIWRCDIPRDNVQIPSLPNLPENPTEEEQAAYDAAVAEKNAFIAKEHSMGIFRYAAHPIDRMRNTWLYLKLKSSMDRRTEIHDMVMTYFG